MSIYPNRTTVKAIEAGELSLPLKSLNKLAKVFGIAVWELIHVQ